MSPVKAFKPQIHALTRMVVGFLFACHGAQKLFGVLGGGPPEMNAMMWAGGVIEFFGGLFIFIGWQTSWFAFLCSGTMAVAYFMFHQPEGPLPIQNHGELAAVYCWIFLLLSTMGDGIWSVGGRKR